MLLIAGLGNLGEEYKNTRHNIGWDFLLKLREKQIDKKIIFIEPDSYMNCSGLQIKNKADYFKIESENIIIIHDDLDLPLGTARIKFAGTSGGHNGIKSVEEQLKTNAFWRLKIGISKPESEQPSKSYVLERFTKDQDKILTPFIDYLADTMVQKIIDWPPDHQITINDKESGS